MDIDISRVRMVGDNVMIRKCFNPDIAKEDGTPLLVLPDIVMEDTNFAEVLGVGPKCKAFTEEHVGRIVHVPDSPGRHQIAALDDRRTVFIIKESDILPAVFEEGE